MGFAAHRYCCCLGSFPTVADAVSPLVWTKAAKVSQQPQLHPEPYRRPHKHVELMSLVLTWSQICLHELQMLHSFTQQCVILPLYKNCRLTGTNKCNMDYMEFYIFCFFLLLYLERLTITFHSHFKMKVILHGFFFYFVRICVFASYTRPTHLWCRCLNTLTLVFASDKFM